jgi:phage-related protein
MDCTLQFSTATLCHFWHITEAVPEKPEQPRKLIWLVDSLIRLTGFPPAVRHKLGFALYQAQIGRQVRADDQAKNLESRTPKRELDLIRQRLQLARSWRESEDRGGA